MKRGYSFENCREVVLGPEQDQVLVCIDMAPRAIDPELAIAGPVEHRYDFEVLAVRDKKRVELLRVPFGFSMSSSNYDDYSGMLFSARYVVDAPAGTIDVLASPEECSAALGMLKPYWHAKTEELRAIEGIEQPFKGQLLRANDLERVSDGERMRAEVKVVVVAAVGQGAVRGRVHGRRIDRDPRPW